MYVCIYMPILNFRVIDNAVNQRLTRDCIKNQIVFTDHISAPNFGLGVLWA